MDNAEPNLGAHRGELIGHSRWTVAFGGDVRRVFEGKLVDELTSRLAGQHLAVIKLTFLAFGRKKAEAAARPLFDLDPRAHPVFLAEVAVGERFPEFFGGGSDVRGVDKGLR